MKNSERKPSSGPLPTGVMSDPHKAPTDFEGSPDLHVEFRSSPIPDPATLREYESVHPGAAGEILNRWKEQLQHRHKMEASLLKLEGERNKRDWWLQLSGKASAVIVVLGVLICSVIMLQIDSNVAKGIAALLDGSILLGLAKVFLFTRNPQGEPRATSSPDPPTRRAKG